MIKKYNTIEKEEINSVLKVLKNGEISGFVAAAIPEFYGGKEVKKLEQNFAKKFNSKYALSVNSATSGIYCMLMAHNIQPGDEVITSPYTMHATASSILQCSATPIFADIEGDTFGLDPKSVEKKISKYTKGILAVNIFGHSCEIIALKKLAKKYNLFLIEDHSQAPGGKLSNKSFTGSTGSASVYSLNRHKIIQCGEGGVVLTNSKKIFDKMALVRNHGEAVVRSFKTKDIQNTIGQNLRLTEIQAAIATSQLKKLDRLNSERIRLCNRLTKNLKKYKQIKIPLVKKNYKHVYYFYVMQIDLKNLKYKPNKIVDLFKRNGFVLRHGYIKPLYHEPMFKKKICFGNKGHPFILNKRNKQIDYNDHKQWKNCEEINKKVFLTNSIYHPYNLKDMDRFSNLLAKCLK